jgi:hypothetical protein
MQIEVHVLSPSIGLLVFDSLSAYLQSKNLPSFSKPLDITVTEPKLIVKELNKLTVLFASMPVTSKGINLDQYDMVLFSNADESLSVSTNYIVKNLPKSNCYLIANSLLDESHSLYRKVISSYADVRLCSQYWRNPEYPQYYINAENSTISRTKPLIFINGANRSWRHHVMQLIASKKLDIPMHSNISNIIHETLDAHWESKEDSIFRSTLNDIYPVSRNQSTTYYDDAIEVGIKTGHITEGTENNVATVPPGYFIMPEYFEYQCIIFPETSWQNNEVSITEKSLKCFYTKSIPWPIGGANLNKLYNSIGFKTAWNLLPKELQMYDSELDHFKRHSMMISALTWMTQNLAVLTSAEAELIRLQNKEKFLDNSLWKSTADSTWAKVMQHITLSEAR